MADNRLRTSPREGKPTFGARLHSAWPLLTERFARTKTPDYVEFLAEYAPHDRYTLDRPARPIGVSSRSSSSLRALVNAA